MRASSFGFFVRYGWFQLKERFVDIGGSIAYLLLYPFFMWILLLLWQKFNSYQGHYNRDEFCVYVSITELLFMTFLRSSFMLRSNADFSMTLARPRSWLLLTLSGQFGATLGGRVLYAGVGIAFLFLMGVDPRLILESYFRLVLLLPLLGLIEALMAAFLASAQLLWHETRYLVLPITKIFLALGGVFAPLVDYGEPGRSIFLSLPASDLFFQVGHFCVKQEFHQITAPGWFTRIAVLVAIFAAADVAFFKYARKKHQSYGG